MTFADIYTLGLQLLLPLALISWLAFQPLRSRLAYLAQAMTTGLTILALLLAAIWIPLPWWLPYVYLALWFLSVMFRAVSHLRVMPWIPQQHWVLAATLGFAIFAVWPCTVVWDSLKGRQAPENIPIIDLAFPLGSGLFLVANGGASPAINAHFLTLNPENDRQRAYRGQSYGVDIVKLGPLGMRAGSWRPSDPRDYAIFDEAVFAPCSGRVVAAVDALPDMPVPEIDTKRLEGNHVVLHCGNAWVLLAHLKQSSLEVNVDEHVESGQRIGRVGNSGKSYEPHLHVHAQAINEGGSRFGGTPYFLSFEGRFPTRNTLIQQARQRSHLVYHTCPAVPPNATRPTPCLVLAPSLGGSWGNYG